MNKYILVLSFAIAGCGGSGTDGTDDPYNVTQAEQSITQSDGVITSKATLTSRGGYITFPSGEKLIIPKNSIVNSQEISISKKNGTYSLSPSGFVPKLPIKLIIPVNKSMIDEFKGRLMVGYLVSDASREIRTQSGAIKADRLIRISGDSIKPGSEVALDIKHFSLVYLVSQDRIYLPLTIPSKYLRNGDIVFALSSENYHLNGNVDERNKNYDWFPGHAAMIYDTSGSTKCSSLQQASFSECDLIESTPDYVRISKLDRDFSEIGGHIYMGARRPTDFTVSTEETKQLTAWAKLQVGKPWSITNETDGDYSSFSCVGLVEDAYRVAINKPILPWIFTPLVPLDMYKKTKSIDSIEVNVGDTLAIKANPVVLDQEEEYYFDLRSGKAKFSSDFLFSAENIPAGAVFDSSTGMLMWNVPASASGNVYTIRFSAKNSWPRGVLTPASTTTKYEYLTINVQRQALSTPTISIDFDSDAIKSIGAMGENYRLISGRNGKPAIKFSGLSNPGYLKVPNTTAMQFTSGLTYDMWVRIDSDTGMDGWGGSVTGSGWAMSLLAKSHDRIGTALIVGRGGQNWFGTYDSTWNSSCTTFIEDPAIPQGTWFRVTATASSTAGTSYYVNKKLLRVCPDARPDFSTMNTQDLYIGKFSDSWYPLDGAIQELKIYKKALTQSEIKNLP